MDVITWSASVAAGAGTEEYFILFSADLIQKHLAVEQFCLLRSLSELWNFVFWREVTENLGDGVMS